MYKHIPYELKELNNWCVFKVEQTETGRMTKRPYNPLNHQLARSNDPNTWVSFDEAVTNSDEYDGIGFFFTEPYVGIDIDDVRQEVEEFKLDEDVDNIVSEFITTLESYAEISPSGNGIHIIVKGELPAKGRRRGNVEIYDKGRFFTMTGNHIGGYNHITDDSDYNRLGFLHSKYVKPKEVERIENETKGFGNDVEPTDLIDLAKKSKNGQRFTILFEGGWEQFYDSQSEADMALANDLAFWTARDPQKMDQMFRMSNLMRDKWDTKRGATTYGELTIDKAIEGCQNEFVPSSDEPLFFVEDMDTKPVKTNNNKFFTYDDTGNAERIVEHFGDNILYNYSRKSWMFYKNGIWNFDTTGRMKVIADRISEIIKREPVFFDEESDESESKAKAARTKHYKDSRSKSKKENMLTEAQHLLPATQEDFDTDKYLFNVQNGYLDLRTGQLHDHDKTKMFTRISEAEYTSNSDAPNWEKFLWDISCGRPEWINYLQKALGYALSGSTKEQKMFVFLGNGRNGKSALLNVINKIMGDYAMNITPKALMAQNKDNGPTPEIAKLVGARVVTTTEPNEGDRFDEGLVKQITGGDKVSARFLNQNDFEYTPQFKIFMATNHKPYIRGRDEGIWRRMVVIPFDLHIEKKDIDYDLEKRMFEELPAILQWFIDGYIKYQREGLKEPECIAEQRDEYRTEMDSITAFIEDTCIVSENSRVGASHLYKAYVKWQKENNQYQMSNTKFGMEMSQRFKKIKSNGRNTYLGITLTPEYDPEKITLNF